MESLLGDNRQCDSPPRGLRRLLYLGIGCRPETLSPKSLFPSGLVMSSFEMEGAKEHDCRTNSYESIDRYFRPMASSLRLRLNRSNRGGFGSDLFLMPAKWFLPQVPELRLRLRFKEVSDGVTVW
jgi:hypothetical protein